MQHQNPNGPLVLYGASYVSAWTVDELGGIPIVNRGQPGLDSTDLVERFDRAVRPADPRAVLIWGINDLTRAGRSRIGGALDAACRNLRTLTRGAMALGIEPVLVTALTLRPQVSWSETLHAWVGRLRRKQSFQSVVNEHVVRLNAFLRELCARHDLLLLDMQQVLADRNGVRRRAYLKPDGNHISPAGYAAVTQYAAPLVAARFGQQHVAPATAARPYRDEAGRVAPCSVHV
jgi:lysophospholipase L1-like esterase